MQIVSTCVLLLPLRAQVNIGSGNGLAPKRCQAIAWTNADPVHSPIYINSLRPSDAYMRQ